MDSTVTKPIANITDLVFQVSLDPIVLATLADCRIINVNNAFCEISGYQRQDVIDSSGFDLELWTIPDDHDRFIHSLIKDGAVKDFETNLTTKSGKIRRVLISAQVFEHDQETLFLMTIKDISDRLEQENAYRLLFANNPKPMWIYDPETLKFLEVNDAAIALYGYSHAQFLEMTIADIRPPVDIPALKQAVENFFSHDQELEEISQWQHRKLDGTIFDVEISSHKIHWQGKTADFVMAQDISDRKQTEDQLNRSLQLINLHIHNSPLAVLHWDRNHHIIQWSKQAEAIFGWTEEDVLNIDYRTWQFVHEDDFDYVALRVRELYDGGTFTQIQIENRNYTKDGRIITCEWHNSAIFDNDGNLISVLSFAQDISDRKRDQEALLKSQNLLNASQKLAKVGGFSYDIQTHQRFWTDEIFNIYELPLDFDINQPNRLEYFTSFYTGGMAEVIKEVFLLAIEQGLPYSVESPFTTAKGKHLWVRTSAEVIMENGKPRQLIGALMDITEQKLSELSLRASEEKFRKLAEDIPCMIYSYAVYSDGSDSFKYVSTRCYDILELDPELLMLDSNYLWSMVLPEDMKIIREKIASSVGSCSEFLGEFRITTSQGIRWLEAISYPKIHDNSDVTWDGFIFDISDRKQTEVALIKSEKLLKASQQLAKVGGWSYNLSSQQIFWTEEIYRIHDLPLDLEVYLIEDLDYLVNFYAEGNSHIIKGLFERAISHGESFDFESPFITAKGRYLWVRSTGEVIKEDGKVTNILGTLMDITEQKLSELSLRASEEKFRKLAEDIPCMIYSYAVYSDGSDSFKYVSPRCYDILELDPDLLMLDSNYLWSMVLPEDMAIMKEKIANSVNSCSNFVGEFRIYTTSGIRWLEAVSYPKSNNNSDTTWEGFIFDISDRKSAEQKLKDSLQHIDDHFENSPLAIIQWNQDHRIIRWSKKAEKIYGWTEAEILAMDYPNWQFLHEDDFDRVSQEFRSLYDSSSGDKRIKVENRNYTKDGRVIYVEWYASSLFDHHGNLISILTFGQDISDRKLQENQLWETQAFLNSIIENIPSMIYVKEAKNLTYVLVNKAAEKFTNKSKDEIIGKDDYDFFLKEEADFCSTKDREAIATNQIIEIPEETINTSQGSRYLQTQVVPILDQFLQPQYILNISDDVSDLKVMQLSLQQKVQQEQIINQITDRIRRNLDLTTILSTTVNELRAALKCDRVVIYKFNPDWSGNFIAESLGNSWVSVLSNDDERPDLDANASIEEGRCFISSLINNSTNNQVTDTYLQDTLGGGYTTGDYYIAVDDIYAKNFSPCYLQLLESFNAKAYLTTPIFEGNQLWGLLASYDNQNARHWQNYDVEIAIQVANQLGISVRQSKLFAQITQQSALQKILMDISFECINIPIAEIQNAINRSLREMGEFVNADRSYIFEYNWDQNTCSNTHEWCAEDVSPQIQNLQNVCLDIMLDWVQSHRQGRIIHVQDVFSLSAHAPLRQTLESQNIKSLMVIPLMDGTNCLGFVGFDSVRKHHIYTEKEESLLKVFSEMIVNIKQRVALEQNLIEEKLKAEESTKAKSEFLAMMSHEIRTPMNAVIGMTDLLGTTDLDEEQADFVEIIRSGSYALLNVLNDILDFSKIEANGLQLSLEPFSLRACLDSVISLLSSKAVEKNLIVRHSIDRRLPETFLGDVNRLRQIIINLLGNSLKFTEQGEVRIDVKLLKKSGYDYQVQFDVIDTGIGISSDRLQTLFQPFQQGDSSITRRYGGTGLGLVISKRLCELMGGNMWVTSTVDEGSKFSFLINLQLSILSLEQDETSPENSQLNPTLRILIVEDNLVNQKVAKTMLSKLGYNAVVANHGVEALELMQSQTFDLLFMDMQMPEMDGVTTTRYIREFFPPEYQPQIIAMTANATTDSMDECFEAGMDEFIGKPVRKDDLIKAISKLFPYP